VQDKQTRDFKRGQRLRLVLQDGYLDDEKAKNLHRNIPSDNPAESAAMIEAGIKSGDFEVMDLIEDGENIGFTVFAIVDHDRGKEFLTIACYAKGKSDVSANITPILEGIAKARGCSTMRMHTMRTGLVKKLSKDDWFVSEIIMRKELV